jgi:hypothetical protein
MKTSNPYVARAEQSLITEYLSLSPCPEEFLALASPLDSGSEGLHPAKVAGA